MDPSDLQNEEDNDEKQNDNKSEDEELEEVEELNGSVLAQWIQEKQKNKGKMNNKYLIIDVRDYDYGPKKIIDAINIPKDNLIDDDKDKKVITRLIEKYKDIENVIFHCRYSMVRGPTAADYYFKYRKDNYPKYPKQKVLVLKGGYAFWEQQYSKLCEKI